jgi:Protein of unknown function (DUF2905)
MASQLGRMLIIFGIALVLIGLFFVLGDRFPWLRLGRLPGDISFTGRNVRIFFPLGTCLLLSVLLTLIFWLLRR